MALRAWTTNTTGHSITDYSRLADGSFDPDHEVQVVREINGRTGLHYQTWEFALSATNLLNTVVRQSLDPNASITIPIAGRPRYVVTRPRTFSLECQLRSSEGRATVFYCSAQLGEAEH